MDLMNALKRLERAGDEHSKTSEKLRDAAERVGDEVCKIISNARDMHGVDLPRGYRVIRIESNVGGETFLVGPHGDYLNNQKDGYLLTSARS